MVLHFLCVHVSRHAPDFFFFINEILALTVLKPCLIEQCYLSYPSQHIHIFFILPEVAVHPTMLELAGS